jgi:hypothetical protein
MTRLSKFSQITSLVFILFLTFHFLLLTPVIHYFCLCPQDDPKWVCTCNCAKCSARRADTGGLHQLNSDPYSGKNPHKGCAISGTAGVTKSRSLEIPDISVETMSCQCKKETKNTVAELKPFIPMLFFLVLIALKAFKFISRYRFFHLEIFLQPQTRPG